MKEIKIIGAGLAGCECALTLSKFNVKVKLYDMKPEKMSPAHHDKNFCELVCSNTFKSMSTEFATGLLKHELKLLGSEVLDSAEKCAVKAGDALAVDRIKFSQDVTKKITENENIEVVNEEVTKLNPDEITIVATGPLTSEALSQEIMRLTGEELYFYDALAPIVDAETIDMSKTFKQDRWGQGEGDYLNCPLNEQEYKKFYEELKNAERVKLKEFEQEKNFEGCLPVEVMAKRGVDVLRFGPMKPVGFKDLKPYAVLQLRKENELGTMYNMVGFQTNLTYPEQKRVFSLIPALKNANFLRYGAMHRNSYINAPKYLNSTNNLKKFPNIFICGQLSGVEGYTESVASGLLCAIFVLQYIGLVPKIKLSINTALGALSNYLVSANENNFQPMHINWGLFAPIVAPKDKKREEMLKRSVSEIKEFRKIWTD